nr:hypothetical protein [Hymenobacter lapidarius]
MLTAGSLVSISDTLLTDQPAPASVPRTHSAKLWLPQRVVFTPDALDEEFGQQILARVSAQNLEVELLKSNRLTGLRQGDDVRATYRTAKNTLAIVKAPAGALRLQPTPPSAHWQLNLAEGCPAHCQYCYLAAASAAHPW